MPMAVQGSGQFMRLRGSLQQRSTCGQAGGSLRLSGKQWNETLAGMSSSNASGYSLQSCAVNDFAVCLAQSADAVSFTTTSGTFHEYKYS